MTDLLLLAYRHGYGYGHGWTDWIAHTIISAIVRGLIYGLIFHLLRRLTLGEGVVLVIFALVLVYAWGRSRDRRGW